MNLQVIKDVITKQLQVKSSLHSLQIQNHIYGCFVLMEDFANGIISLNGYDINYQDTLFNIDTDFSKIGLKYGFVISDDLILKEYNDTYKELWLDVFKTIDLLHDIDTVDSTEDELILCLKNIIPEEINFFTNALDTGRLSDEWLEKIFDVIEEGLNDTCITSEESLTILSTPDKKDDNYEEKVKSVKTYQQTRRRIYRRITPSAIKTILSKTRRHIKSK